MTPVAALQAPTLDDFHAIALAVWENFPADFARMAGNIVFRIQDFADDTLLDELGIEDPFELTGLYSGTDLTHASVSDPSPQPSIVYLFRRPILDEWAERGDVTLGDLVAHVLIHEVGHHFGLSDAQIDALLDADD